MNLRFLRPIGSVLYYTATTLNPMRLYHAAPNTRLAVAGSILGLTTVGGVATVMTPKSEPSATDVALVNEPPLSPPTFPQPVRPLPDNDADPSASRFAPPPGMFSQDMMSSRRNTQRNDQGATNLAPAQNLAPDAPQDFNSPPRFATSASANSLRDPSVRHAADAASIDPTNEPAPLPGVSGAPPVYNDRQPPAVPFNRFAAPNDIAPAQAAVNDPPVVEPTQTQPLLPQKPTLRGISDQPPPPLPTLSEGSGANGFGTPPTFGGSRLGAPATTPALPPPALNPSFNSMSPASGGSLTPRPIGAADGLSGNPASIGHTPIATASPLDGPALASPSPGAKQLEGLQAPSLAMEKAAPKDVQVGKLATFQTKVRNVGKTTAHQITVIDHVPAGTRLENATPQFSQTPDGTLLWKLGTLQPGEETTITMQVIPEQEGEVGSVAQVMFQAQASVRAVCTKPNLTIKHTAPQKVLIGEAVPISITITNNGSGAATGLVLSEVVPDVLSHPAGTELENEIGILRPGETKSLTLQLRAAKAGIGHNVVVATNDSNATARDELDIEVIAPQLQVGLAGPKVRFLERQATYTVLVANPGTAPANNVEMVTFLPRGLKFVSADKSGQYNSQNHAVYWSLDRLPANITGEAQLVVLPIEIGEQKLRVEGRADLGLQQIFEQGVQVEGLSELQFEVADVADPVEVGGNTTYEVKITNRGHKPATNVQLLAEFSAEVQAISGEGPSRVTVNGNQAAIDPIPRLAPGAQAIFKLQARGVRPGQGRVRVQLQSDEAPSPVLKEESTRIYADM